MRGLRFETWVNLPRDGSLASARIPSCACCHSKRFTEPTIRKAASNRPFCQMERAIVATAAG
eukprot:scaffold69791_cov30-Tisochrysis_lutea.AAC.2